jgi:hypothetical protein
MGPFLGRTTIRCRSSTLDKLVLIKRVVVGVCAAAAIAVGILDVMCPDEERKRFESLKFVSHRRGAHLSRTFGNIDQLN